mmetsp:Transcript_19642/g.32483  ORF Transcript_19642/g.32483 Transcript_19642/m.32483 type:complete len:286 (-) Transcript_19642:109-966(-)
MKLILPLCIFAAFFANCADAVTQAFGLTGKAKKHQSVVTRPTPNFRHDAAAATSATIVARGGACDDANAALFGKVGISALLQAAGLMGVLALGKAVVPILSKLGVPDLFGTSPALWAAFFLIIFASSIVGTFVDGGTSAALNQALDPNTTPGEQEWYQNLKKPSWNPPGWLFPIMWLIVSKPTQLAAVNRLWTVTDHGADRGWRLFAYCMHLALGDAWNKTFFGYQCVGRGLVVISAFYSMLLFSAYLFGQVDPLAGKLMLPTCGWVTVATALNWSIYSLNKSED